MSRLYDALKNAQANLPPAATEAPLRARPLVEDAAILRLSQAIDTRLADRPHRIIQVMGCGGAEDSSGVARRLAHLSAVALRRSVLFVDPALPPLPGRKQAGHPAIAGLPEVHARADTRPPARQSQSHPYAATTLTEAIEGANLDLKTLRAAWQRLRGQYDLVLINAPPAGSPLGLALAPTVDGVVLVVEAERTHVGKAETARDGLIAGGANVLGVVLDKRRYWVPRRIWDWL